jgi:hypothetical protein
MCKPSGLFQDGTKSSTPVTASDLRDGAKGATIGTTFCNLHVSDERRGGQNARRFFIVKESGLGKKAFSLRLLREQLGELLKRSGADEEVHFGQFLFQNLSISLGKASSNNQKTAAAFFLKTGKLENRFDSLLRRILNKRTGVDDEDIRS